MEKAYDRLSWPFLYKVLQSFGFSDQWINLIRNSVEDKIFTALVNGIGTDYFKNSRGLRQGDPLSPSLFIIAAEYLSRGLEQLYKTNPKLEYESGCNTVISHLAYADDIIIFTRGCKPGVEEILGFLKHYEKVSGQRINTRKSSLITNKKMTKAKAHSLQNLTGFAIQTLPFRYLGAKLYKGRKKIILYDDLMASIRSKLSGWDKKLLSQGSRLQLIKSVLLSMPIYLLQIQKPPKSVLQGIEKICARFLWGSTEIQKKIHWTKWTNVCYPIQEGGLGIRSLEDVTDSFTTKLWWRMRTSNSIWAKFMQGKYFPHSHPNSVPFSAKSSATWKRIAKAGQIMNDHIKWKIGEGGVYFWNDNWFGDTCLKTVSPLNIDNSKIQDFWKNEDWDREKLNNVLPLEIVEQIRRIHIDTNMEDLPIWKPNKLGIFTTKSAWDLTRQKKPRKRAFSRLWSRLILPTISLFSWKLLHGWIPVDSTLQEKGLSLVSKCQCCEHLETLPHVFLTNDITLEVWQHFYKLFNIPKPISNNFNLIISFWENQGGGNGKISDIIPILILWFIWKARNEAKYDNKKFKANNIIGNIYRYLHILYKSHLLKAKHWIGKEHIAESMGMFWKKVEKKKPITIPWIKPPKGFFKINVDASFKNGDLWAGVAGVMRDENGFAISIFQLKTQAINCLQAELLAIWQGLQVCLNAGIRAAIIESDSLQAIQMITGTKKGEWIFEENLHRILQDSNRLQVQFKHVAREGNKIADILAKETRESGKERIGLNDHFLHNFKGLLALDREGKPNFRFFT